MLPCSYEQRERRSQAGVVSDADDLPSFAKAYNSFLTFPEKLMFTLMHIEKAYARNGARQHRAPAGWVEDGKVFYIRDPDEFMARWLPLFFAAPAAASAGGGRAQAAAKKAAAKKGGAGTASSETTEAAAASAPTKPTCAFKFKSFTRKLYRWGFRQVSVSAGVAVENGSKAQPQGAQPPQPQRVLYYHHEHFQRNQEDLLEQMRSETAEGKRCGPAAAAAATASKSKLVRAEDKKALLSSVFGAHRSIMRGEGENAAAATAPTTTAPHADATSLAVSPITTTTDMEGEDMDSESSEGKMAATTVVSESSLSSAEGGRQRQVQLQQQQQQQQHPSFSPSVLLPLVGVPNTTTGTILPQGGSTTSSAMDLLLRLRAVAQQQQQQQQRQHAVGGHGASCFTSFGTNHRNHNSATITSTSTGSLPAAASPATLLSPSQSMQNFVSAHPNLPEGLRTLLSRNTSQLQLQQLQQQPSPQQQQQQRQPPQPQPQPSQGPSSTQGPSPTSHHPLLNSHVGLEYLHRLLHRHQTIDATRLDLLPGNHGANIGNGAVANTPGPSPPPPSRATAERYEFLNEQLALQNELLQRRVRELTEAVNNRNHNHNANANANPAPPNKHWNHQFGPSS